jgi:Ni,Fe-hydrogenase I small subunit
MIRRTRIPAWECICEQPGCPRRGKPWYSIGRRPPVACSTCKSREWNGKKARIVPARSPAVALPKPKKVREFDE